MDEDISSAAMLCYFLLTSGTVWLFFERCSDWGTARWGDQVRAFILIGAALLWIFTLGMVGNHFANSSKVPDIAEYDAALLAGLIFGAICHLFYKKLTKPHHKEIHK